MRRKKEDGGGYKNMFAYKKQLEKQLGVEITCKVRD